MNLSWLAGGKVEREKYRKPSGLEGYGESGGMRSRMVATTGKFRRVATVEAGGYGESGECGGHTNQHGKQTYRLAVFAVSDFFKRSSLQSITAVMGKSRFTSGLRFCEEKKHHV